MPLLHDVLRRRRLELDLSLEQAAEQCGMTVSGYRWLETQALRIDREQLAQIAEGLDLPSVELADRLGYDLQLAS